MSDDFFPLSGWVPTCLPLPLTPVSLSLIPPMCDVLRKGSLLQNLHYPAVETPPQAAGPCHILAGPVPKLSTQGRLHRLSGENEPHPPVRAHSTLIAAS